MTVNRSKVTEHQQLYQQLGIESERIQKLLGYLNHDAPAPVHKMIDQCLEEARKYSNFKSILVEYDSDFIFSTNYSLAMSNLYGRRLEFFLDKIIFSELKKSEKIIAFVSTAGDAISRWSKEFMKKGDLLNGYIVDAIGSEIVESGMDNVHDNLEIFYKNLNLSVSNRYSPGYCGWDVSEQQKLFKLFKKDFSLVQLTASSLMKPSKSISGLIGVGKNMKKTEYTCKYCNMDECVYRNRRI